MSWDFLFNFFLICQVILDCIWTFDIMLFKSSGKCWYFCVSRDWPGLIRVMKSDWPRVDCIFNISSLSKSLKCYSDLLHIRPQWSVWALVMVCLTVVLSVWWYAILGSDSDMHNRGWSQDFIKLNGVIFLNSLSLKSLFISRVIQHTYPVSIACVLNTFLSPLQKAYDRDFLNTLFSK